MIKSLSDILVVSDMDNTLLTAENGIPACNLETIRLFTSLGGHFTVATGRTVNSVRHYLKNLPLSTPAITYGGAVLYDYTNEKRITNNVLNKNEAIRALDAICARFKGIGIEIMAENGTIYIVQANEYTYRHTLYEKLEYTMADYHNIPYEWNKILFATDNKTQKAIDDFTKSQKYNDIYFLATHKNYYEIMNNKVSKGRALKQLCSLCNIAPENTFAIGDYFNDLELMRAAGYSAAVENAPKEVRNAASEVVASCTNGGVGQFIYSLIKKYGN